MAERKSMLQKGGYREPLSPISLSQAASRTPMRKKTSNMTAKTPTAKTPLAKTPGKKGTSISSSSSDYDRFIPNRALMNNKLGHHMLMKLKKNEETEDGVDKEDFTEAMRQNLNGEIEKTGARILQMKIKAPQTKEGD
eukprot:TCONS_00052819-protein